MKFFLGIFVVKNRDVREGFYDPCGNEDTYFCKEYKASDFPAVVLELPLTILELELPSEKTE